MSDTEPASSNSSVIVESRMSRYPSANATSRQHASGTYDPVCTPAAPSSAFENTANPVMPATPTSA